VNEIGEPSPGKPNYSVGGAYCFLFEAMYQYSYDACNSNVSKSIVQTYQTFIELVKQEDCHSYQKSNNKEDIYKLWREISSQKTWPLCSRPTNAMLNDASARGMKKEDRKGKEARSLLHSSVCKGPLDFGSFWCWWNKRDKRRRKKYDGGTRRKLGLVYIQSVTSKTRLCYSIIICGRLAIGPFYEYTSPLIVELRLIIVKKSRAR
jgi:hypothetical protein